MSAHPEQQPLFLAAAGEVSDGGYKRPIARIVAPIRVELGTRDELSARGQQPLLLLTLRSCRGFLATSGRIEAACLALRLAICKIALARSVH